MINRKEEFKKIAEHTLEMVREGKVLTNDKQVVSISTSLDKMRNGTILYKPTDKILIEKGSRYKTTFEIASESTLQASKRLVEDGLNVVSLNFASAKKPGGGFLNGSVAQEESLARSSALYESLKGQKEMYEYNMNGNNGYYSDYMIYSPNVPVFKNDQGTMLDHVYEVSFITSPAVNKGVVVTKLGNKGIGQIKPIMKQRITKILKVGLANGHDTIVLGAFGCGVFKNEVRDVANYFKEIFLYDQELKGRYKKVVFAIYKDDRAVRTFKEVFKGII